MDSSAIVPYQPDQNPSSPEPTVSVNQDEAVDNQGENTMEFLILVLLVSVVIGAWRGLLYEVLSVLNWLAAWARASSVSPASLSLRCCWVAA
mgnify:CR=1 FL=1